MQRRPCRGHRNGRDGSSHTRLLERIGVVEQDLHPTGNTANSPASRRPRQPPDVFSPPTVQARAPQRPYLRAADVKKAIEIHRRDGRRHRHWKLFDIISHWSALLAPLDAENVTDAIFPPFANR